MSNMIEELFREAGAAPPLRARPVSDVLRGRAPRSSTARHRWHAPVPVMAGLVAVVVLATFMIAGRLGGGSDQASLLPARTTTGPTMASSAAAAGGDSSAAASFGGPATAAAPKGFLQPSDLGTQPWAVGVNKGDRGEAGIDLINCAGKPVTASTKGTSQAYRGISLEGGEWLLVEDMIALDQAAVSATRSALHAMIGCPEKSGGLLLASNDAIAVFGVLQPDGAVGMASAYAVVGHHYIKLVTLPGGAVGGLDLPGQTQWLIDVMGRAVTRLTGTAPALPKPNALAKQAAAKYQQHPDQVVIRPDPNNPNGAHRGASTPVGATSDQGDPTNGVPAHFLSLSAFDSSGYWITTADPLVQHSGSNVAAVPVCGANGLMVSGQADSVTYTSRPGKSASPAAPQEWMVTETVVALTSDAKAEVARALASATNCQGAGPGRSMGVTVHPVTNGVIVISYTGTAADHAGHAEAVTMVGDRMVVLTVFPGPDSTGAEIPGGLAWVGQIAEAARAAAA